MKYIVKLNRCITREFQVEARSEAEAENIANDEFDELELPGNQLFRADSEITHASGQNLHVKNDVNLKVLIDYGFKPVRDGLAISHYLYMLNDEDYGIYVGVKDRILLVEEEYALELLDVIYDLIKANIIEKY